MPVEIYQREHAMLKKKNYILIIISLYIFFLFLKEKEKRRKRRMESSLLYSYSHGLEGTPRSLHYDKKYFFDHSQSPKLKYQN